MSVVKSAYIGCLLGSLLLASAGVPALAQQGMPGMNMKGMPMDMNMPMDMTPAPQPTLSSADEYTLAKIRKLADENNPTIAQAKAQIAGEKGKALQAGLVPNPSLGYIGELMGERSGALGEFQGGGVSQEIILGGKLKYSRKKYQARVTGAEAQARSQYLRVMNDVEIAYYHTLAMAQRVALQEELERSAQDTWITKHEMFNLGQANEPDLLQAEIYLQKQKVHVKIANTNLDTSWRKLCALVGTDVPYKPLSGSLEEPRTDIQWTPALERLLKDSPELAEARAKLRADEITVQREIRQIWPNLAVGAAAGYDQQSKSFATSACASVTNLPLFNRNQGTIQQARADLDRQKAQVKLVELQLKQQLAEHYRYYCNARDLVDTYRSTIVPESRKRYSLCLTSYRDLRLDWPSVLDAQSDYFSNRLMFIDHLLDLQSARVRIEGFMLSGGLTAPAGVTPPGHIDATPQPR